MSYIPGPYYVLGPYPSINIGPCIDGGCGGESPEPPYYEPVAQIYHDPEYKKEASQELQDTAVLLAAAPEMAEALQGMSNTVTECLFLDDKAEQIAKLFQANEQCRDALEKATRKRF